MKNCFSFIIHAKTYLTIILIKYEFLNLFLLNHNLKYFS
jgi:hypothetical protein